jgi:hypothetical protein
MPLVHKRFTAHMRLERRGIAVSGELDVFAIPGGKGGQSPWAPLRTALEELGFRFVSEEDRAEPTAGVANPEGAD